MDPSLVEPPGANPQAHEPRLMISKIVCENFKSYAGVKELGPFHKVPTHPLYTAKHEHFLLANHVAFYRGEELV